MKVIWEPLDIRAGQRLFHPRNSEHIMIGYTAGTVNGEKGRYLIISLVDGSVFESFSYDHELVTALNNSQYIPLEIKDLVEFNK